MWPFGNKAKSEEEAQQTAQGGVAPVDSNGGIDFMNNAMTSEAGAVEPVSALEQATPQPVIDSTTNNVLNADSTIVEPEMSSVPDIDTEGVVADVEKQFANAGIELSGAVVVQPVPNAVEGSAGDASLAGGISNVGELSPMPSAEQASPDQQSAADSESAV